MVSKSVPETPGEGSSVPGTIPPISENALSANPFVGWTTTQVLGWAKERLKEGGLSNTNIVVLDQRTNEDYTCLVASKWDAPEEHDDYLLTRSDFESSIVSLSAIEMGCGGRDMVDTDYEGSDGVLRIKVRNAAEKKWLERRALREG